MRLKADNPAQGEDKIAICLHNALEKDRAREELTRVIAAGFRLAIQEELGLLRIQKNIVETLLQAPDDLDPQGWAEALVTVADLAYRLGLKTYSVADFDQKIEQVAQMRPLFFEENQGLKRTHIPSFLLEKASTEELVKSIDSLYASAVKDMTYRYGAKKLLEAEMGRRICKKLSLKEEDVYGVVLVCDRQKWLVFRGYFADIDHHVRLPEAMQSFLELEGGVQIGIAKKPGQIDHCWIPLQALPIFLEKLSVEEPPEDLVSFIKKDVEESAA